jgi:hypothetical protein
MKHLKTFENFNSVDEGIGSDIVSFSRKKLGMKTKEEEFREELDKFMVAHSKRMKKPTDVEIEKVMNIAKKDNYEGKPGLDDSGNGMVLKYRKSDEINWKAGGHTFGSGE